MTYFSDSTLEKILQDNIKYLKIDLREMDLLEKACFPVFAAVNTGIEFISGLIYGFKDLDGKGNSKKRYKEFIKNYMSIADSRYGLLNMDNYLYLFLRNKLTHEAGISGEFVTDKDERFKDYHLKQQYIAGEKRIYIHPIKFRDEFFKALEAFENEYTTNQPFKSNVKNNLLKSLQDASEELKNNSVDLPRVSKEPAMDSTSSRIITILPAGD